jgi:hypothetical protein
MRLEVSRKIEKDGYGSITLLKGQLRVGLSCVFMQLCIKLIIMEESTKKIFKPKFELVQECNGLVSYYLVSIAAAILKGQKIGTTQEDHQMLVVCRTPRDIAPTHWELA